jgi:putative hydrolase of the HAD superfamily
LTRAVIFDVDGVLVHGFHARPDLRETFDDRLRGLGINADRFQREFIHDIFMKRVLVGEVPMVEALDRRLKAFGYKGSTMTVLDLWMGHDCFPNTALLDAIRTLKTHPEIRLYLATNQDHSRAQFLWQSLGLKDIFEDMFYSARFGRTKAHKKFYEMAEERMPSFEQPPLFFDDTPKVIDAARAHGWEAVLFDKIEDCADHPWIAARLKTTAPA